MKNLKKFFAVVLAVAMIATMVISVPVMADSASDAAKLQSMGLLNGSNGDLALDEAPDRIQALTMLLYMTGEASDAAAYMSDADAKAYLTGKGFTDVNDVVWGWSILAYCIDNGYLYGSGTKLDAHSACTAEMFAAYMMRVLVSVENLPTWDGVSANMAALQAKGAYSAAALVNYATGGSFTRGDAASIMFGTLSCEVEKDGKDKTVAQKLFDAGVITAEAAAAAGVNVAEPTPTPAPEVAVVEINGLNLVQAEVIFNMDVDSDSAEDVGNYKTSDKDITIAKAELQDDDKTVVLTFDTSKKVIDQQGKLDITVEDVEDLNENAIDDTEITDVRFTDTKLPEILDVEVTGVDNVKVTFSEPIKTPASDMEDSFVVRDSDDDKMTIKDVKFNDKKTTADIILSDDFETGDYTVEVKDNMVDDYAGFSVQAETFELEVEEDTEAPTIVDYKDADDNSVTLIFNEDIELDGPELDDFYHTNSKNTIDSDEYIRPGADGDTNDDLYLADDNNYVDGDSVSYKLDGKELTLYFSDNNLPNGTAYVYIEKDVVKDKWDNKAGKLQQAVEVEYDGAAPEVDEIEVKYDEDDGYYLEISFVDDDLDQDEAADDDNYVIEDEDGDEVDFTLTDSNVNSDTVKIFFDEADISGDFTITITGLTDTSDNEMDEYTEDFTIDDEAKPVVDDYKAVIYNPEGKDQLLVIDFGEEMATSGEFSVLNLKKYTLTADGDVYDLSDVNCDIDIDISDDGSKVELTIPSYAEDDTKDGIDIDTTDTITVGRVADKAGNYSKDLYKPIQIGPESVVAIDKIEATEDDTIVVTLKDLLDKFEDADFQVTVYNDTYTLANDGIDDIDIDTNDDGNSVITITMADALNYDLNYDNDSDSDVTVDIVANSDSKNEYGESVSPGAIAVKDKIAPGLVEFKDDKYEVNYVTSDRATGSAIYLTFEEDLDDRYIAFDSFEVSQNDVDIDEDAGGIHLLAGNDKVVVIHVKDGDTDDNKTIDQYMKYGVGIKQVYTIKDMNGNKLTGLSTEVFKRNGNAE